MPKNNILFRSKLKKARSYLSEDKFGEANEILTKLSIQYPGKSDIWLWLGFIAEKHHEYNKAIDYLKKALKIDSTNPDILFHYGIAQRNSGNFDDAIGIFSKLLQLDPENSKTLNLLAHVYMGQGNLDKAADVLVRSLSINQNQAEIQSNLGTVYHSQGELSKAEICFRKALSLNPQIEISDALGNVLVEQGRFKESLEVFQSALTKQPKNVRMFSNMLLTLNYMEHISQQEVYDKHKQWSDLFENPNRYLQHAGRNYEKKPLRIGYFSPDFREHSVAHFIEPVLEHHNKDSFTVYAYYPSKQEDAVTVRLKQYVDIWRDVSDMSPDALASAIYDDDIDIMVDLVGHTANNSLLAFTRKPAPVQITYLGYPNTTGVKAIQYRITDATADPDGQDQFYSEKLCRLPGCFLTYKPDQNIPEVSRSPVTQNNYITFGSFNNLAKMNDGVIRVWCEILKMLPDSKLFIKNPSLTDRKTRITCLEKFNLFEIDESRITLTGHTPGRYEHLSLYGNIDIALDTFPYNGTTTTCEALWMGLPVITLCGNYHAARVSASLLTAADRSEWIASSETEYVDMALQLARDIDSLKSIRQKQRDHLKNTALYDHKKFVRALENEYIGLWHNATQ